MYYSCVERKSIPDLLGSFASGRLYKQVESMRRHYATPLLLIEFDPEKPFSLLGGSETLGADIELRSILSKLVLLVLAFVCASVCFESMRPYSC